MELFSESILLIMLAAGTFLFIALAFGFYMLKD